MRSRTLLSSIVYMGTARPSNNNTNEIFNELAMLPKLVTVGR